MDRQQLARSIDVGRTSTLNCFETTKDIAGIAAEIDDDDPFGPLFRNKYLNDTVVLKIVESHVVHGKRRHGVEALIYFPYNHANVYEGGDSILASDPRRSEKLKNKCGLDPNREADKENVAWDLKMIAMIESLPTLDPFLLKCKAQQLGIEEKINPAYFNISLEEWNRIQRPIRRKIEVLVRRALGITDGEAKLELEEHISKFLRKIWEARDVEGIEYFVRGLDMRPERAPELFFAWKAICYYQVQFSQVEPELRKLFAWLGNAETALPVDFGSLRHNVQEQIKRELKALRARLKENYLTIVKILKDYEESYREFIEDGRPAAFKEFLGNADNHYLDLAACLSANSHAINLFLDQVQRSGTQMVSDQHKQMLDYILGVFGVELDKSDVLLAS
jgi:hypothetical protein